MPVYRGPDGKIIEEKTRPTDGADRQRPPASPGGGGQGKDDIPTDEVNRPPVPPSRGGHRRDDRPTTPIKKTPQGGQAPDARDLDERTRINIGTRRRQKDPQPMEERTEKADSMDDPVVGWLVIVDGPGKGKAMQLGYGQNAIGRGETARVKLNFGDNQISRGGHAVVTYDPRGRKFYLQHGGGTNLTYLNDEPVLAPAELPALSHINIGNTILRFVPLCGDVFDWQDTEE